jgi:hypothetical protein
MRTKSHESARQTEKATFIRECLICKRGVAWEMGRTPLKSQPDDKVVIQAICEDCRKKYLPVGVALVNPDTESIVVVMDETFKSILVDSVADPRIIFTGVKFLERIHEIFSEPTIDEDEEGGGIKNLVN